VAAPALVRGDGRRWRNHYGRSNVGHLWAPLFTEVELDKDDFTDRMVELFAVKYCDHWSVDELLLHPREAALFCDDARRSLMAFDVPDDVILRVILGRRKNPTA
jgi:hypothetical protein